MLARHLLASLLMITASAIVGACGGPPPPQPIVVAPPAGPSFIGRWNGVGEQRPAPVGEGEGRWDMVAVIATTDAGQCGTIDYSTLGCSGVWICSNSGYNGNTLVVTEQIRVRNDRCLDGGQITMTFNDPGNPDSIEWRYTGGGIQAWAELHRSRF